MQLFPYQEVSVNEIFNEFYNGCRRLLYQLSTGGGKTFIFSFTTKRFIDENKKKVVILCHKEELITQTIASLNAIGVTAEALTANTRNLKHNAEVYVCMIETANNRLKKNPHFFHNVGLVIADECHILIFDKVYSYFKDAVILGCSATPIVDKKVNFYRCRYCKTNHDYPTLCCGTDASEWVKPFTLSNIYEKIVIGVSIKELIDMGRLVPEISFVKHYAKEDELKIDTKTDEFSSESMDAAYNNEAAIFNCLLNYEEICKGKKTMIFNGTTKNNKEVYEKFKDAGYNVRMYDSVHSTKSERKNIVKWFEDEPDAILCNVGCFTTGFDVQDVEAIILNRPTNSLSLFLQIAGRGGRTTKKIYKPNFILIDGGGNIERFNEWSDSSRDWVKLFYEGSFPPREKRNKGDVTDVNACMECGFLMQRNVIECPNCGYEIKPQAKRQGVQSKDVLVPIREIPPPNKEKIHEYTLGLQKNVNFAFTILENQIVDMFRFYRVSKQTYINTSHNGKLKDKIQRMVESCYWYLLAKDDIKASKTRSATTIYENVVKALNEMYQIKT